MIGKLAAGILGGVVIAVLGLSTVLIAGARFASHPGSGAQASMIAFFVLWVFALALAVTAKRAAKAWRRLLVASAVLSFFLLLSSLEVAGAPTVQASMGLGDGGAADAAIVGLFLGIFFLVLGLFVGRDRPAPAPRRRERRLMYRRRQADRRTTLRWDAGGGDRRHRSGRRQEDEWDAMKAELSRSF